MAGPAGGTPSTGSPQIQRSASGAEAGPTPPPDSAGGSSNTNNRRSSATSGRRRLDLGQGNGAGSNEASKNRGGPDLAALFVNAQRRNADKQRKAQGEKPKPPAKQQQQQTTKPGTLSTPKQEARPQPRDIPRATTPATRTIHAALGVSRRKETPPSRQQRNQASAADKSEFQRGAPPPVSNRVVAGSHDDGAKAANGTDSPSAAAPANADAPMTRTPPKRQLYHPPKSDTASPSSRHIATGAGTSKQLYDPKLPPAQSTPANKPTAVQREERSISPLPLATLSAPAAGAYAADAVKQAYRQVQELEAECLKETEQQRRQTEDGNFRRNKSGSASHLLEGFEDPNAYWIAQLQRHKELAEAHHHFLFVAADPLLPPSLRAMPQKHNTPLRLWQHAIHLLLERIRHSIVEASYLTDLLLEFLHYAYGFYTCLLEDHSLDDLRHIWLEQLGDLARYRMAVANILTRQEEASVSASSPTLLSSEAVEMINETIPPKPAAARIDDEEGAADWGEPASFGAAALEDIEIDDVEIWKRTALEWYSLALAEMPTLGRLHHHLALLHRQDGLKCLYHYCKSLVAAHPHHAANESILSLFSPEDQSERVRNGASPVDLFVHLQGMIFTRVSLDQFDDVLDRFVEALERSYGSSGYPENGSHAVQQPTQLTSVRWIMIAVITIASLLDHGKPDAPFAVALRQSRRPEGSKRRASQTPATIQTPQTILLKPTTQAKPQPERSESGLETEDSADESDDISQAVQQKLHLTHGSASLTDSERSIPQSCAQKLAFRVLRFAAQHRSCGHSATLNPLITVLATFVSRLFAVSFQESFATTERLLPWQELVALFNSIPHQIEARHDPPSRLSGRPLPEDWCLRGMDWAEHGLYVRGFWKQSHPEDDNIETPASSVFDSELAVFESESEELFPAPIPSPDNTTAVVDDVALGRWKRLAVAASNFVRRVPGLSLDLEVQGGRTFKLSSAFAQKISGWRREDAAHARTRRSQRTAASIGSNTFEEALVTDESDNELDDAQTTQIKAKRRDLRALIRHSRTGNSRRCSNTASDVKVTQPLVPVQARPGIKLCAGYTVLVADATVLLRTLPALESLLDSRRWTVVVPLAVISDIDTKRDETSASQALSFLEARLKTQPLHLKVQTSKGNYLQDLRFRSEEVAEGQKQDTMTLVLRCALWQQNHFTNRIHLVNPVHTEPVPNDALKVGLLTLNQKFRQKARHQGVEALNDTELLDLAAELPDG